MKSIIIEFENGKRFKVSCKEVALNRTNYYAEHNNLGHKTNAWHEEFETSMQDDILLDWIQNDMNWEDVELYAIEVPSPEPSYSEMYCEATFKIGENE